MSKSKQKSNTMIKENMLKHLRIFLIASLMVIIFYPPYLQGLFFEKHVLPTLIFVFIVFIIFLIYKWLKNDNSFFKTPIEYISLGFVVVYFISIFVAVHTRSAIIEWLKYCMYFAVFYMVSDLADDLKTKMLFLWTIVVSAVGVSIIGLDAALGGKIVELLNQFFKLLGAKSNLFFGLFVENRIHSTLQYPNALASYLMAVFFVTIGLLVTQNKWWKKLILSSFAFILFLTFMLTQSRGAQLLFPVAVIILLIASPKDYRIKTVTHVLLFSIPSGIISLFIAKYLSCDTLNHKVIILLITGLLITAFITLTAKFIGNILQKINWRTYIIIISIFLIVIVLGVNYVLYSSVPIELSLLNSEESKLVSISRDIGLKPNKEYILRLNAEGKMNKEKAFVFYVRIYNKNLNNVLFDGSELLKRRELIAINDIEELDIMFNTKEDTKLININFAIYYSGTSVKIKNAFIIDPETGKTVKRIILKNKYNLDNVLSRYQNILMQQSFVSRAILYKDGFNIFRDKWFLGAGGGAWNYLYRQYQSYNYASSQAHNYLLQLGIETGLLGIIMLLCLVIISIVSYVKYYKKHNTPQTEDLKISVSLLSSLVLTAIAFLFMHSVIDFDFSECSMLLLFWQLIALFNREIIDSLIVEELNLFNVKVNKKRSKYTTNERGKPAIIIGFVVSAISLYFTFSFAIASSSAKHSFESLQNNELETAIEMIEKAIKMDRFNEKYVLGYIPIQSRPDIKAGFADILLIKNEMYKKAQEKGDKIPETELVLFQKQLSKVNSYIEDIEKKAKNNLSLTNDLASYYFKTGEIDKGINYLNLSLSYYPFEPSLWYSKIDVYFQLMGVSFNKGDYKKAEEYLLKGLNVINEAKEANKKNMNPFVFNLNSVELLQKMRFIKDNWSNKEISDVNEIIHYSVFDLDINMDGIPDQWGISNKELLKVSVSEEGLYLQATEKVYLYSYYPIKLKKGKTYCFEVSSNDNIENLNFYLYGITAQALPFSKEGDKYKAELKIEKEPDENGNQLRIFIESECVVNSILVKEMQ